MGAGRGDMEPGAMRLLAFALLLAGCAGAPPGMRYANPNCIYHCVVEVVDAGQAQALATLTATQGSTATGGTRSRTTTETETGGP
jgi:starvation-inducible outer membrane lipoprotein